MFLGLDIGTSGVKTVIINDAGDVIDSASAPLTVSRPHPKWSEQDPRDWWSATCLAVGSLNAEVRKKVRGIGLSGQMHGATLLDHSDEPIRPAILWNDGRSDKECLKLEEREPAFISKTGNLIMPGFTAPKLAWVRTNEPKAFERIAKVLLPKDFIRLKMTGDYASDMSDSAGTSWMDVENRTWHQPLLNACGLELDQMPNLFEGHELTGYLVSHVAADWGMSKVPVYAGGGDNAAGALGAGILADGDTMMSLGTSGVIFSALETYKANPADAVHSFCHALPKRWHLMSVMLSAASCLDWACRLTGAASAQALIDMAKTGSPHENDVLFLPYLSGERTPHNNPDAKGVLFGLTHDTGPSEIALAVLEGIAFGMAEGLDTLRSSGANVNVISVIGGGSQSTFWGEIFAGALETPLIYREGASVGPALGAARLAQFGTEGAGLEAVFKSPEVIDEITPNPSLADLYEQKRTRFSSLYKTLENSFAGN